MSIVNDIKNRYITGNIVEKLIFINITIFVVTIIVSVIQGLYEGQINWLVDWFSLDDDISSLYKKPWSIITYGFLHADFLHVLMNLMVLYFIGNLFLEYFTQKQLLSFYLLGTFFGGVLFIFSQNYFPLFQGKISLLVGASAGISAIFIGIATYIPNYQLKLRFIGFVKLWHLAAIWIGLDVIGLIGDNAGGNFAHLGGALFGFLYVKKASNTEIKLFDKIADLFKTKKKSPLKTVHKSKVKKKTNTNLNQQQIDEILDKISKSGYDTLTKAEKDFLFRQGKK
ncbi:rhomboid family intramembrane serine protease [Polaribacter reichenbachii]|uniref:Rhomboid family intramembrane serine protease n=1 Tax=Polaribacter reichenbachii TaxID=996801 RepID=A0A1B8TQ86_9FLAO|nr:rhomboid family intramembrane serine protease [Polaribacter reichenbachii]APZ48143.1 rhomboid family intramembrane serine protease [Polaribacter reichenbachii]AUC20410.1 rhomboid family intramembrane serine protease [Polaribacter reichenbachii]OBY61793.1 rhomboid family intramembrane serine protease [Polaribacter reichenbachii]